jgi:hypothetical protein
MLANPVSASRWQGLCAGLVLLAAAVPAQGPDAWARSTASQALPSGAVSSIGRLTHFVDSGRLHVWSATTRQWLDRPVGPAHATQATNDWVLLQQGTAWSAFGAGRGRFADLTVGPTAQVVNPPTQRNDSVLLVRDGPSLHAFSGFTGRWTSRTVSGNAVVSVRRNCAILADGTRLAGFSAYSGQWTDVSVTFAPQTVHADGSMAVAMDAATLHGYSALRETWASAPAPGNLVATHRGDDWYGWYDGASIVCFSGIRGSFAATPTGLITTTHAADALALFESPGVVRAWSAITGTYTTLGTSSVPTVRLGSSLALVSDQNSLIAWSAVTGSASTRSVGNTTSDVAGNVAYRLDHGSGQLECYSALTGSFHVASASGLPPPRLSTTAAIIPTASGCLAFSIRTGSYIPLQTPPASTGLAIESNPQSSPVVAWDANTVYAFDGRRDRWLIANRNRNGTPQVHIWRATALVFDGNEVFGFGSQSGSLERIAVTAAGSSTFRVNSESATIVDGNEVLTFSAVAECGSPAQFPEFRRVATRGSILPVHVRMNPADVGLLGLGFLGQQPTVLGSFGELLLDPATMNLTALAAEPDSERGLLHLSIPDDSALRDARVWAQAMVLPASASPYLTEASELVVL